MNPENTRSQAPPVDILVVDDSPLVRQALKAIIELEPGHRVLHAADPYEAVAVLSRSVPAVIVLDVDMPRMDGLTFLQKLMRQHPMPVLLCTDHVQRGLKALEMGALEVIPKPDWTDEGGLTAWGAKLRESLRQAAGQSWMGREPPLPPGSAREAPTATMALPRHSADVILPSRPYQSKGAPREPLIVMGASTGGVQAVARLLADLPRESPGVVVVQHMPGGFTGAFADRLNRDPRIALKVAESKNGDPVQAGVALVIPGHWHGLIRRAGAGYRIELVDGPPVNRHRPSVDVLFRSAAQAGGPRVAAALLTGMGDDGAQGLLELREAGAWTIAQNEQTCVVFGMPRRGAAREVLPLHRIARSLLTAVASRTTT